MPPEDRFVTRFAAEPPQDVLPSGRWADTLTAEFLAACLRIDSDGADLGEAGAPPPARGARPPPRAAPRPPPPPPRPPPPPGAPPPPAPPPPPTHPPPD